MLYRRCANVTEQDIQGVESYTQTQLNNTESVDQFMATFEPMIRFNRREAVESFDIDSLPTITPQSASINRESTCLFTGESYEALTNAGSPVIVLQHGDNEYSMYKKEHLLEDWINRGKSMITNEDTSLESYQQGMFKLIRGDES